MTQIEVRAVGDGETDDWQAIQDAINAACDASVNEDKCCQAWVDRGCVVFFPTPKHSYLVSKPLLVPGNKAITFMGASRQSVAIRLGTSANLPYVFIVEKSDFVSGHVLDHPSCFERLTLVNGGIAFLKGHRGWTGVRECAFIKTSSWAILDEGPDDGSTGDTEVSACIVQGCARGIGVGAAFGNPGWCLKTSRFTENSGADLVVSAGGCHVTDCDFEGKAEGSKAPFVVVGVPGGDVRFNDVRFGGRVDVPRDFVVVGPESEAEWTDKLVADVQFVGCDFFGALSSDAVWKLPSDTEARSAIRLAAPVQGLQIRECTSGEFQSFILESGFQQALESELTLSPGTEEKRARFGERCRENLLAYHFEQAPSRAVFGVAGRGFEVVGRALRERLQLDALAERRSWNLLAGTEPAGLAAWSYEEEILEIGGSPGPEFIVKRISTRAGLLQHPVSLLHRMSPVGGRAVFSAWFRVPEDVTSSQRIGMAILGGKVVVGGNLDVDFPLSTTWTRCFVTCEYVPPVPKLLCVIRCGGSGDEAGTILMRYPQLEQGDVPSAFIPAPATGIHAVRDDQSLVIGPLVIGYAQPSDKMDPVDRNLEPITTFGRRIGDGLLNVAPAAGGPDGWVCVEHLLTKELVWRRYGRVE